jgi:hypothetical protein
MSALRPCRFTPGERAPYTHWIGGWVCPRAGLDDVQKRKFLTLPGLELQPVSSRYTDYAIPVPYYALYRYNLCFPCFSLNM